MADSPNCQGDASRLYYPAGAAPGLSAMPVALEQHQVHPDEACADLHSPSSTKAPSAERVNVHGILRNYNTIEDFKNADKTALLDSLGDEVRFCAHPTGVELTVSLNLYRSGPASTAARATSTQML